MARRAGFSLLEALLALAIVAFGAALAAPHLSRGIAQAEARAALSALRTDIQALRLEALGRASMLEVFEGDGWTAAPPLVVTAGGLCEETQVTFERSRGALQTAVVLAPDCAVAAP